MPGEAINSIAEAFIRGDARARWVLPSASGRRFRAEHSPSRSGCTAPPAPSIAAPGLSANAADVLRDVLGYDADAIDAVLRSGAVVPPLGAELLFHQRGDRDMRTAVDPQRKVSNTGLRVLLGYAGVTSRPAAEPSRSRTSRRARSAWRCSTTNSMFSDPFGGAADIAIRSLLTIVWPAMAAINAFSDRSPSPVSRPEAVATPAR